MLVLYFKPGEITDQDWCSLNKDVADAYSKFVPKTKDLYLYHCHGSNKMLVGIKHEK